jgi:hypothetical protein
MRICYGEANPPIRGKHLLRYLLRNKKDAYFFELAFQCNLFILLWCGREDLNLHEIAPASTSS